jgi:hypothetical protein
MIIFFFKESWIGMAIVVIGVGLCVSSKVNNN